ncbi:hypothetical protein [Spirosoma flavum]|uniref:Uncharacterized protein n=1 Tax=Spirosoma flavum TaxID=2048557 RepID=A0ABW6AKE3_9BACT
MNHPSEDECVPVNGAIYVKIAQRTKLPQRPNQDHQPPNLFKGDKDNEPDRPIDY